MELEELRRELEEVDRKILEAIAERQQVARHIEAAKAADGRAIRDYQRERAVLERTESLARNLGLEPGLARELMQRLIGSSLAAQERQRIEKQAEGAGRRALVIGGAGRMGGWFARFLSSQGFQVEIADPAAGEATYRDWREATLNHELVVLATPLRTTVEILHALAEKRPAGVVLDLGSLKSPLAGPLRSLAAAGIDVASIHPLFGPDTEMLSGRHVALIDLGRERATTTAKELFASTMATVVPMQLEEHDRLMAWILGVSHAVNLAFVEALRSAGLPVQRLAALASTTFDRQLSIASRVAGENPSLYFEIQSLNPHAVSALDALAAALSGLSDAVRSGDEAAFVERMERGRRYLETG